MPNRFTMIEDRQTPPLGRRVFRDEIREQLIDDILSGRLAPGTRIVETRIAQKLGVSQAPVREALRDLALLGFVVSSPFRGTEVRRISPRELLEIYPIRAALEGAAARAAAPRIRKKGLQRLEELIEAMRDAGREDDHRASVLADADFHHTIVAAAGNKMLERVWETMRLSVTTSVTHAVTHRSLVEIAERHVPVYLALRRTTRCGRSSRSGSTSRSRGSGSAPPSSPAASSTRTRISLLKTTDRGYFCGSAPHYRIVRKKSAPGGAEFVPELVHNRSGAGSQVLAADLNKDGAVDLVTSTTQGAFIFFGSRSPARAVSFAWRHVEARRKSCVGHGGRPRHRPRHRRGVCG